MAEGADRPELTGAGAERPEGRRHAGGAGRRPGTQGRPRADAEHRAARQHGLAAQRRAAPLRLALHAAQPHRADRPQGAGAGVWKQLGRDSPTPEQILDLKVCDPAMGSGAFLVEACRQLGDALVKAWQRPRRHAEDPADETPELFAQRHDGPALPVRRGQEPDGRRSGQAVAVAGDTGQGPSLHVPRPRPALRRFAGGPDAAADRRLPLEDGPPQQMLRPGA